MQLPATAPGGCRALARLPREAERPALVAGLLGRCRAWDPQQTCPSSDYGCTVRGLHQPDGAGPLQGASRGAPAAPGRTTITSTSTCSSATSLPTREPSENLRPLFQMIDPWREVLRHNARFSWASTAMLPHAVDDRYCMGGFWTGYRPRVTAGGADDTATTATP